MKIVLNKVASSNVVLVRNTTRQASLCFYPYHVYAKVVIAVVVVVGLFGVMCAALSGTV